MQILLFLNVSLSPCVLLGVLASEEHKQTASPKRALHSLAEKLEAEKTRLSSAPSPSDSRQRIENLVIEFMTLQGFTIPAERKGPGSKIALVEQTLLSQHAALREHIERRLPASATLAHYSKIFSSPEFPSIVEDTAYAYLLEGWKSKIWGKTGDFFPSISLKGGMLVFHFHPQDLSSTRQFLSSLFDILDVLGPIAPQHEGLQHVFSGVQKGNKETTLKLWGASAIEETEKLYKEQRVLILWKCVTRALDLAKQHLLRYKQAPQLSPTQQEVAEEEYQRACAAYNLGEYFIGGTQFTAPKQARTDLLLLNAKLCKTPSSFWPMMKPVYVLFGDLLLHTYYQTREACQLPLSSEPDSSLLSLSAEYRIAMEEAHRLKEGTSQGVEAFSTSTAQEQEKLITLGNRLRERITERARIAGKALTIPESALSNPLSENELDLLDIPERIQYLRLHEQAMKFRHAFYISQLKQERAVLNIDYLRNTIHLKQTTEKKKALERERKLIERDRLHPTEQALIKTLEEIQRKYKHAEEKIKHIQQTSMERSKTYETHISHLKLLQSIYAVTVLQRANRELFPLEAVEHAVLETLKSKASSYENKPAQDIKHELWQEEVRLSLISGEIQRKTKKSSDNIVEVIDEILKSLRTMTSISRTPVAFSGVVRQIDVYKGRISRTFVDPIYITESATAATAPLNLFYIFPTLLHNAFVYHFLHKQPLSYISQMFQYAQQSAQESPIKASVSSISPEGSLAILIRKLETLQRPSGERESLVDSQISSRAT